MNPSTSLSGSSMAGVQLSQKPTSVWGTARLPNHRLGSFFRKRAWGGSQSFGIYLFFSPARTCGLRCAHPDPRASCAFDPFGPHITSAMTLVARDADSCCLLMTQVHGSTPCGPSHSDARTSARSTPPPLVRWRCDRAAVGTHGEASRGL